MNSAAIARATSVFRFAVRVNSAARAAEASVLVAVAAVLEAVVTSEMVAKGLASEGAAAWTKPAFSDWDGTYPCSLKVRW